MGSKAARKRAFLKAHPVCCFCGAPATTEDHVPARVCFKDRVWPEGFVFPACEACNQTDRDAEHVVAFHLHSMTENHNEFTAAFHGLKNNYPHALPNPFLSPAAKAKALSNRGITLPAHVLWAAPVVRLAPEAHAYFHRFAGKLAKALFYKHLNRPIPDDYRIITHWTTADQPGITDFIPQVVSFMPGLAVGARVNTDLGDQFYYRFNVSPDHDYMVFMAGFSHQVFFTGLGAREGAGVDFDKFLTLPSWHEAA